MGVLRHKEIPYEQGHAAHSFEYADRATRLSMQSSDFETWEVGRLALQKDNGTYWRLAAITPSVIWKPVSGSSMFQQLQSDQITNTIYNGSGAITRIDYSSGFYCTIEYTAASKPEYVSYYKSVGDILVEKWQYTYNVQNKLLTSIQLL